MSIMSRVDQFPTPQAAYEFARANAAQFSQIQERKGAFRTVYWPWWPDEPAILLNLPSELEARAKAR